MARRVLVDMEVCDTRHDDLVSECALHLFRYSFYEQRPAALCASILQEIKILSANLIGFGPIIKYYLIAF